MKTLASLASGDQKLRSAILAPADDDMALMAMMQNLRSQGERVVQQLPGDAAQNAVAFNRKLVKQGEEWVVAAL